MISSCFEIAEILKYLFDAAWNMDKESHHRRVRMHFKEKNGNTKSTMLHYVRIVIFFRHLIIIDLNLLKYLKRGSTNEINVTFVFCFCKSKVTAWTKKKKYILQTYY